MNGLCKVLVFLALGPAAGTCPCYGDSIAPKRNHLESAVADALADLGYFFPCKSLSRKF